MKKIWIILALMLVVIGILASAAPTISVDNADYNFGSTMEGAFVRHTFVVTNTGNQTLEISRVRSTCGCTTSSLSTNTLAPGQSVNIEIVFDSVGYGGHDVQKTVYVESNDPKTPRLSLHMIGHVDELGPNQIAQSDLQYLLYALVDLRAPEEYEVGHILGAINIPYAQLGQYIGVLPMNMLMIVYDADGTLSDQAVATLIAGGYRDAKSLYGGISFWIETLGTGLIWPMQE